MPKMDLRLLEPTDENITSALCENKLWRLKRVVDTIRILFRPDEKLILAIDGDWGSGKTFFLKGIQKILLPGNDKEKLDAAINMYVDGYHPKNRYSYKNRNGEDSVGYPTELMYPFYFNAWEHDDADDPLTALVHSMLMEFSYSPSIKPAVLAALSQAGKEVIDSFQLGSSINRVIERFKESENNQVGAIASEYSSIMDRRVAIRNFMESVLSSSGRQQLVIIIDELDRCRPDYAVKLLERIKHFFDGQRVSFIIGVNISQLEKNIKHHYGYGFNARVYLKRFFDMQLKLPVIYSDKFQRHYDYEFGNMQNEVIDDLSDYFKLSLRSRIQLIHRMSLINVSDISWPWNYQANCFLQNVILPTILVLDYVDSETKDRFINGCGFEILNYLSTGPLKSRISTQMGFTSEKPTEAEQHDKLEQIYKMVFSKDDQSAASEIVINECRYCKVGIPNWLSDIEFLIS